jgi:hypothetical protein
MKMQVSLKESLVAIVLSVVSDLLVEIVALKLQGVSDGTCT